MIRKNKTASQLSRTFSIQNVYQLLTQFQMRRSKRLLSISPPESSQSQQLVPKRNKRSKIKDASSSANKIIDFTITEAEEPEQILDQTKENESQSSSYQSVEQRIEIDSRFVIVIERRKEEMTRVIRNSDLGSRFRDEFGRTLSLYLSVDEVIREYVKFFLLKHIASDFKGLKISPSRLIDDVWHLHLLDTASYRDFNEAILGKESNQFFDHNPRLSIDKFQVFERLRKTIILYRRIFKEEPNSSVWPVYTSDVLDPMVQVYLKQTETIVSSDHSSSASHLCFPLRHSTKVSELYERLNESNKVLYTSTGKHMDVGVIGEYNPERLSFLCLTIRDSTFDIIVRNFMMEDMHFKVRHNTPILSIINAIANNEGICKHSIRLVLDGQRLSIGSMKDYDIEQGTVIDFLPELGGC